MMNLLHLQYLLEIAQCKSISQAAQNLFISQPYLSKVISKVEQDVGFAIFVRTLSGIKITKEGELFLEYAGQIKKQIDNIYNIKPQMEVQSNLSIATVYSSMVLQSFLDFQSMYKNEAIHDEFCEDTFNRMIERIVQRKSRIGISINPKNSKLLKQDYYDQYNLETEILLENVPVRAIVYKGNPLSKKKFVTIEELKQYPFVYYKDTHPDEFVNILGLSSQHEIVYVSDRGSYSDILRTGRYVSVTLEMSRQQKRYSGCCCLPIKDNDILAEIKYIKPKQYELTQREKQFLQFLKTSLEKEIM